LLLVVVVLYQTLLSRCPRTDNILEVLDDSGWNILQRVIICNQPQVASMLLARGGLDLNAGVCTSPLHLACKLGHAAIVQVCYSTFSLSTPTRTVDNVMVIRSSIKSSI